MNGTIKVVKCRALVDGQEKHWIMSDVGDNAVKARQIFDDIQLFSEFSISDSIVVTTSDPGAAGLFTYVDAGMSMSECIAYTVQMNGDDLSV
ncbi:hypothetical protein HQ619_07690 [Burkholderia gladioli]|uniref:hypothetical protein n=1 Tax=Burkholderia gladioli TaxID=28095 RepID=UPI00155F5FE1|nr:hypothetical protein [Burkholderia gladioli]NRF83807.1 hypothetical protein [Burkholderia gladioli]